MNAVAAGAPLIIIPDQPGRPLNLEMCQWTDRDLEQLNWGRYIVRSSSSITVLFSTIVLPSY